ncbi:MAG: hypothetical protein AAF514_17375 [Verrucomicrobiota bacterium]
MSVDRREGYLLFEVMIALTVFGLVAVGLATAMNTAIDASHAVDKDRAIRHGLTSILQESQARPKKQMAFSVKDERLQVEYKTELIPLQFANQDGEPVENLFILRATASFEESNLPQRQVAEIYVHR